MTASPKPERITGPLKTWYDLHEALEHEVRGLAAAAAELHADGLDPFADRFVAFDRELRAHSEVEDGVMFPAIEAAGGIVPPHLGSDHRDEQLRAYELGTAVLHARAVRDDRSLAALAPVSSALCEELTRHLRIEEEEVLTQVDGLFGPGDQAVQLRTIISSLPADPGLQPWIAAALSPEHLEARLRNMAAHIGHDALVSILTQIRDGVDDSTWAEIRSRTPELAELVDR